MAEYTAAGSAGGDLDGLGEPLPAAVAAARAGLIEGWRFDRAAFGITQPAYQAADPAHWLALETAARALADGGFPGGQGLTRDRTGVIVGNTLTGEVSRAAAMRSRWPYVRRVLSNALTAGMVPAERHADVIGHAAAGFCAPLATAGDSLAGSLPGAIADRICGHFGFRGGGYAVDAAHSSSLLAVAAACAALAAGDLDAVIAGGVDISIDPFELTGLAATGALATSQMRVFDAKPTGFWPGEGCGLVVLMRARDAQAAGVATYAQIAGWGVSSAGNPALTKPGSVSLLLALRRAYQRAGVDPADVQLIEGDGTGTASGDLAELTSLAEIRQGAATLAALGSIKANIGHTKAAAGAAGLLKATLAVCAGVIPPATGCIRPHPLIANEDARLRAPRAPESWPERARMAAVSSVGPGGTSVHVVLRRTREGRRRRPPAVPGPPGTGVTGREGAATASPAAAAPPPRSEVFAFAAADAAALAHELDRVADLAPWLSDGEFHDLACQAGRQDAASRPARAGLVAATQDQLAQLAREAAALLPGLRRGGLSAGPGLYLGDGCRGRVTLLFPGELSSVATGAGFADGGAEAGTADPALHPAMAAASQAALRWLDELGVTAAAGIGHGLGEITALVWAGCLPEPDAARLVAQRAALLAAPSAQRTALVCLDADSRTAQEVCASSGLAVAAYNGPRCHVLAGPAEAVQEVARRLADEGIPARLLDSPHGFYSPAMADRVAPLRSVLRGTEFRPPQRRLISTVTGADLTAGDDITTLLCTQLTSPVLFASPLRVAAERSDLLVETGPGHGLSRIAADCCEVPAVSLGGGAGDEDAAAQAAAALFAVGAAGTLRPLLAGRAARRIDIWRERVFIPSPCGAAPLRGTVTVNAPLGSDLASPAPAQAPPAAGQPNGSRPAGVSGHAAGPEGAPARASAGASPGTPGPGSPGSPGPGSGSPGPGSGPAGGSPGSPGPGSGSPGPGSGPAVAGSGPAAAGSVPAVGEADRTTPAAPPTAAGPSPAPAGGGAGPAAAPPQAPLPARADAAARAGDGGPAGGEQPGGGMATAEPLGAGPWVRCFTEELRPEEPPADQPGRWRLRLATAHLGHTEAAGVFAGGKHADTVLVIIGDPAEPGACGTLLKAVREAGQAGRLVVLTHTGGLTGFCASLHAEQPGLGVTVVRTALTPGGLLAARPYASAVPGRFREVILNDHGAATRPVMRLAEPAADGTFPLGPADVILVTGVTRPGDLACATALAGRGAALAVLAVPGPDDPRLTAQLAELRAAGARVGRKKAELSDPGQVAAAVRSLERGLGPVTAVVHAPAARPAERCARLSETALRGYLVSQQARLSNVLNAVAPERLRVLVTFGPVAARYGGVGRGCEALGAGLLAEHAARLAAARPRCRALHVDWAPWDEPGAAADPADAAPIPVMEAANLLLDLLTTPDFPARVAVHGRLGPAARAALHDGPAAPPLTGRFLQTAREYYPGVELVADTTLSARSDPYLMDYRIEGLALLPPAMALEAMAQAASALVGGFCRQAREVSFAAPVVLPGGEDGTAVIRVCALAQGDEVETVLRCGQTRFRVDHARAVFRAAGRHEAAAAVSAGAAATGTAGGVPRSGIVDGTDLYGPVYFQAGRFRRVAFLPEVSSRGCQALVRGGDTSPWFGAAGPEDGPAPTPLILGSPGLNDAVLHVIQACLPHRRLLAAGCESVTVTGLEVPGALRVGAGRRPPAGGETEAGPASGIWDVAAVDVAGQPVVTVSGLWLRDMGPLPRGAAWHPTLLASSLEARAAELGIDPALHATISSGAPLPAPPEEGPPGAPWPGAGGPGQPWASTAPGAGALDGFELTVTAGSPVACRWEAAGDPAAWDTAAGGQPADDGLLRLRERIGALTGEGPGVTASRLRTIAACLIALGREPGWPCTLGDACDGGWVTVHTPGFVAACTVTTIAGVPAPVTVAVAARLTPAGPAQQPEPVSEAGQPRA